MIKIGTSGRYLLDQLVDGTVQASNSPQNVILQQTKFPRLPRLYQYHNENENDDDGDCDHSFWRQLAIAQSLHW